MSDYNHIANLEAKLLAEHNICENISKENARLLSALTRLYKVAKNRMPSEPTLDEIEALCEANGILNESEVK